ncbi:MAG: CHASE3 domain sensor protein [Bacteriovoracaceae bacterium]|jgi:CHASE3 domain sensor protein
MYKSIKSLAVLILFSTLFVSCASTQRNEINSKMSDIEKEKKDMLGSADLLRSKISRFERYDR